MVYLINSKSIKRPQFLSFRFECLKFHVSRVHLPVNRANLRSASEKNLEKKSMPSIENRWIVHAPPAETPLSPNSTSPYRMVSFNLTLPNGRDNGQERVQGVTAKTNAEFTRPQFRMRSIERYQVLRKTTLLLFIINARC